MDPSRIIDRWDDGQTQALEDGRKAGQLLTAQPSSLAAVSAQCDQIEAWAAECDAVADLKEAANRLHAIDEYLERTSSEGRNRVFAALRHLEVRIGELLGPAPSPQESAARKGSLANEPSPLTPNERSEFRRMAENPDAVEDVISQSSDKEPASRRKVLGEIKERKAAEEAASQPEWPDEDRHLRERMLAGETVVVNIRRHRVLIAWAEKVDRYVKIDRTGVWGNPFLLDHDGDRATVIDHFGRHYLPHKPSLLSRLRELRGKALGCWCAPEACHGDVLAREAHR